VSTIWRIDFIGVSVLGPLMRAKDHYKPSDWPRWTAGVEGPYVVLEGEGRRIEVPRARCVVYLDRQADKSVGVELTKPTSGESAKGKRA
jgi:hypothetical protein